MAQVILANQKPFPGGNPSVTTGPANSFDIFFGFWKLTRALLAAGWKYKASGDATSGGTKDTSGNFLSEKWGIGGGVQLNTTVQNGTGPNITANTDGTATVTFSGSTFTANSVGRFLTIAGCTNSTTAQLQTNSGNNGTFRIVTETSATSIKIFNPGAVTENTAAATWAEVHGAANGTISTAGSGGATTGRAIFSVSSGSPFVAPTTSPVNRGSVGDRFTVIGGAVSANNGTFIITRVISSTSVEIDNASATSSGETNNGSLSWAECSPTAQTYPNSASAISSSTNATPIVVTMSVAHNYMTGDVVAIQNHTTNTNANGLWTIFVTSATAFQLVNSTGNGTGAATGTVTNLTRPTGMNQGAWENLQGPSTMKIPIGTNTPSTAFYTGEKVTQTTSGATGTIIGVVTDTSGGNGFLVIEPRIPGSGSGPRGWTSGSTDTVSAAATPTGSGASVTSSTGTPIEYVRELVIWKGALTTAATFQLGFMWVQCVDQSGESASRFSQLATAAGVTNVVAPGGVAATFPSVGSWVLFGTANSGSAGTSSTIMHNVTGLTTYGSIHVLCATCIENANESADGSWTLLQGNPAQHPEAYIATTFMHMDGNEDGDIDPYVAWAPSGNTTNFNATATVNNTNFSPPTNNMMQAGPSGSTGSGGICSETYTMCRGWRRRGFASGDAFQLFFNGLMGAANGNVNLAGQATQLPAKVANHPNPNIQIREPLWAVSTQSAQKMRKGYYRWWFVTEGGVSGKLHANGAFIQVGGGATSTIGDGPLVVGPWDGVSTPFNG